MENRDTKFYLPKRPRLKDFHYSGPFAYFLTLCTHKQLPYFTKREVFELALPILKETASSYLFVLYAYCFMPDHLHLLPLGTSESSTLKGFVRVFKQKSGFAHKEKYNRKLWQPSFYDHVLRKEDSLREVALYIFNNPVRKGLVGDFREYPFLGSQVFDLSSIF